ncbi:MAG TPA: [FeFe] hydrogenase H-cluster maturation GTPase HydF [Methylomusa anaerophila]|uniref:tRNA modification GTPase MnmE n=1 Tax=Methylomusa anaerophila TaxID=1930071 RepID=A0A348AHN9_9FIRM|nr:[FeFe] hydrogenase H-cluster maturation GTPase HydF [Methylomusa anaerophila]BBB90587.1 tRNA modification GTPase MnmE [Methylomusa anaerophila]HML88806.1 [FeFe] hydrogenase H-cluster maturation GTPase HydF [Methylomusa anaerophila]
MQDTPKGSRLHIAIFGRRNAGKSSLINALTNQDIALVSDVPGTTTDPVYKAMEILPIGPVMIIDTAGIDDVGDLGTLRVERTMQVLHKADLAIIVVEPESGVTEYEHSLISAMRKRNLPVVCVLNKTDLYPVDEKQVETWKQALDIAILPISARTGAGIEELKGLIIRNAPDDWEGPPIIGDLINPGDMVVLVVPIDLAAPKGRLILPQVQTIRDLLDNDACAVVVKERELKEVLENMAGPPRMVVTDSQEFMKVSADTPPGVLLTSFSILFARHKGDLETLVAGAKAVDHLKAGDKVLISEGCTHHRQADDIGRVKIPRWLRQTVGDELSFEWTAGSTFPENLQQYKLIVHCGACMLNRREMLYRLAVAREAGVPIVNYGLLIAKVHGILQRALKPFPLAQLILEDK